MNRIGTGLLGGSSFTSSRFSGRSRTAGFVIVKAVFVISLLVSLVESILWTFLEYNLFERVKPGTGPDQVNAIWWFTLVSLALFCLIGLIAAFKENFKLTALFVVLMFGTICAGNLNSWVVLNAVTNVTNMAALLIGLTYVVYISSEERDGMR